MLFGHNIAGDGEWWGVGGGEGGRLDEPKAEQKIVVRSRVLCNNYLVRLFDTVPTSFVLHGRINTLFRMEIRDQSSIISV